MSQRRRVNGRLVTYFCLFSLTLPLHAQEIKALARLDSSEVMIGDHFRLNLKVSHPAAVGITWPVIADTIVAGIEVLAVEKNDTLRSEDGGQIIQERQYVLTSFDSGFYVIPPFAFRAAGDSVAVYETDPMLIHVQTVIVDTTAAIRPIKDPLDAPFLFAEITDELLIAGIALLLLAGGVALYLRLRKKKPAPAPAAVRPAIPPHEEALAELHRLKEEKLWQQGLAKQYHTRLTDIVRAYIEKCYGIPARELTSAEITVNLRTILDNGTAAGALRQLLLLSDLVKFAKVHPLPDENNLSYDNAVAFVNATKNEPTQPAVTGP